MLKRTLFAISLLATLPLTACKNQIETRSPEPEEFTLPGAPESVETDNSEKEMLTLLGQLETDPEFLALSPDERKYSFATLYALQESEPELLEKYSEFYTPARIVERGRSYCSEQDGAVSIDENLVKTELLVMQLTRQNCELLR